MSAASISILAAMDEPRIWAGWFRDPTTWAPWRTFLSILFGLPVSPEGFELYTACTGRSSRPAGGFHEAWLICGRRAGKSFVLALVACFLAVFRDWKPYLSPGEVGVIKVIATDRRQARVIHKYCRALVTKVPAFAELIEKETEDEIVLTNNITIEIQSASFRSVRGFTLIAALCDEISYWRTDEGSANPDSEILNALRPAMATIPGSFLLAASSPYSRRGELWRAFRQHHGNGNSPVLCWQAPTRTMNPTVPQSIIDEALEDDPSKAAAEYLAEFRSDIETFVSREVVEAAVVAGRHELPWVRGTQYFGFVDPSGAAADAMTVAIAHTEDGRAVLDAMRERRPKFSPESVTEEFAQLLKDYRITSVRGDRYGGEWPRERFRANGVIYEPSEKSKSAIYGEVLAPLNSGRIELLDHGRLVSQLCSLERRTGRGTGKDSIDHPPGSLDDIANAVCGALLAALEAGASRFIVTDQMLQWARQYRPPTGPGRRPGVFF